MSINPYESPTISGGTSRRNPLRPAAVALLVVAGISIALLGVTTTLDALALVSGFVDEWERVQGVSKRPQVTIRMIWGTLILISNAGSVYGGLQMLWLKNRTFAWLGCVLACIPCFSPCLVFGIPFGAWGLIALSDPQLRGEFEKE